MEPAAPRVQALTASLTVSVQNLLRITFYDLREKEEEEEN